VPGDRTILVALGSIPKAGGTYTFYRNLRPTLAKYGIDLRCVTVGRDEGKLWDEAFAYDGCVLLAPDVMDAKRLSQSFSEWCERSRVDIVIGLGSRSILSALPHLSPSIRVLGRVASIFDSGYRNATACYDRLDRIVVTTPRMETDLQKRYGVDSCRLTRIPNGVDVRPFQSAACTLRGNHRFLRVGFLGRLEDVAKGVLFLPKIVKSLNDGNMAIS